MGNFKEDNMQNIISIQKLRDNGYAPIVNLEIFDSIKKLKLDDYVIDHHNETINLYKQYLDNIESLGEKKINPYLETIKNMECIDNQSFEKEDSFLIAIYSQIYKENAIDYLLKNPDIDCETFIEGHKKLLYGTKNEQYASKDYRDNNETYVGYYDNGNLVIDYFPISYTDIEEAIDKLLDFYHSEMFDKNMFLKGYIIHGLIATLQMFSDGNSRYGRILQNIKINELTKKQLPFSFNEPALYGTRAYMPFRYDYRKLIKNLAINHGNDEWEKWFNFNLNRAEDSMYFLNEKINAYKKMKI